MQDALAPYAAPLAAIGVGALIGYAIDRFAIARVRAAAARRLWRGGEQTARALSGMNTVLGILAGTWFALEWLELSQRVEGIAHKWLLVAVILVVTIVSARLATGLTQEYTSRDDAVLPSSTIFVNIVRIAVLAVGALIALNAVGVSITPLLTALGVGGLAVALALQDTLSNLFSGLQLVGSRQINPGEYIALETGEEGYVEDITWRFTTIRQMSNNLVVVPNAKLATSRIINYHAPAREMSVLVPAGVAYGSDLEFVERVTIETANEVMGRIGGPIEGFEPLVRFHTFGPNAVEFNVVLRVREFADQHLLRHEFIKALHDRYEHEGVRIPFAQHEVTLRRVEHPGNEESV